MVRREVLQLGGFEVPENRFVGFGKFLKRCQETAAGLRLLIPMGTPDDLGKGVFGRQPSPLESLVSD
jgi:hypothetical protein